MKITLDKSYDPVDFITRLSSSVNVHEKTRRNATKCLIKAKKLGIVAGKNPIRRHPPHFISLVPSTTKKSHKLKLQKPQE
ncbi:hypothetical protein [Nitrosopumilus sp.]|uniref:hypothetical protein n=1 Tax=Nitrosopumilus sp. TaxID=2024843 RepID=UPI0029300066|nr:hypothetical protein [Nitrosopumilus sp.]